MERKGIKVGFLGYCDHVAYQGNQNCSEMRSLFTAGPAIYQESIATRDVKMLKEVCSSADSILLSVQFCKFVITLILITRALFGCQGTVDQLM